jgi:translation initiation factor IF-2
LLFEHVAGVGRNLRTGTEARIGPSRGDAFLLARLAAGPALRVSLIGMAVPSRVVSRRLVDCLRRSGPLAVARSAATAAARADASSSATGGPRQRARTSPAPTARWRRKPPKKQPEPVRLAVTLPHAGLTAKQLSLLADRSLDAVLTAAREVEPATRPAPDTRLPPALIELVVDALRAPLEVTPQVAPLGTGSKGGASLSAEQWSKLPLRVPVVTIMGHVDVGKTTLLDALRKSNVAAEEKGGITQSIGAFCVSLPAADGGSSPPTVTFIDTPGHEAFTSMRAQGAGATDVVVLVVAADDGVMPQTVEAVEHARAAGVPIVVAINKCDKEGADPGRARYQLLDVAGVNTEQLGGDVQCVEISARSGLNLDSLVEAVLLQAELLDLRADAAAPAEAICLESRVDRQVGQVASLIVRWGRLRVGDYFVHSSVTAVTGDVYGRVRSLVDSNGDSVSEARPGDAVVVSGFRGSIQPGAEIVAVAGGEREAKALSQSVVARNARAVSTVDMIQDIERRALEAQSKANAQEAGARAGDASGDVDAAPPASAATGATAPASEPAAADGAAAMSPVPVPVVNVIIKADVQGVADAVAQCVERLSSAECPIRILQSNVGDVTENDVQLVSATRTVKNNVDESLIVAFNVRVSSGAKSLAKRASVDLLAHALIYKLEEDVIARNKRSVQSRQTRESVVGVAGCTRVFDDGAIAGCLVQDGSMLVGKLGRVLRFPADGLSTCREVVHEEEIASIRQFAKDVKAVAKGSECGVSFEAWKLFVPGDVIECVDVQAPAGGRGASANKKAGRRHKRR